MTAELDQVFARIHRDTPTAGWALPVAAIFLVIGSTTYGLASASNLAEATAPVGVFVVALVYLFGFRQPLRIGLLLARNARWPDRRLIWRTNEELIVLDCRLFCERMQDVQVEEVHLDRGRRSYLRFTGKTDRICLWTGYFDEPAEKVMNGIREGTADPFLRNPEP